MDSMKGFLIFLVVLGHTIEAGVHDGEPYKALYTAIYSFHMPMFVMISGFVFSVDGSFEKLKRGVINLAEALVVFQFIHIVIDLVFGTNPTLDDLVKPKWTLWYLFSLIVWRVTTFVVLRKTPRSRENFSIILFSSFLLALLAGFIPIDSKFVFQRTFTFFPCFIIGVILRQYNYHNNRRIAVGGYLVDYLHISPFEPSAI